MFPFFSRQIGLLSGRRSADRFWSEADGQSRAEPILACWMCARAICPSCRKRTSSSDGSRRNFCSNPMSARFSPTVIPPFPSRARHMERMCVWPRLAFWAGAESGLQRVRPQKRERRDIPAGICLMVFGTVSERQIRCAVHLARDPGEFQARRSASFNGGTCGCCGSAPASTLARETFWAFSRCSMTCSSRISPGSSRNQTRPGGSPSSGRMCRMAVLVSDTRAARARRGARRARRRVRGAAAGGRLVLVAGEAGVGKTALLRRFCERHAKDARDPVGRLRRAVHAARRSARWPTSPR